MEYRILGRTGLRVSAVALGCEGFIHKTPEEVCADFDFAIGHGVNFIDIYSPNPELRTNIGAALEGRRGDFVIQGHLCTTWENGQYLRTRDPEKTLASFDLQLQQLRTDCLDIGMIHYVDADAAQNHQRRRAFTHHLVGDESAVQQFGLLFEQAVEVFHTPFAEDAGHIAVADYARARFDMQQVDELQPLVVGQEGRVSFHGLSFQYPNRSAARCIASTISTPNGHRGSHSPQPMHSEAWCASVR